MQVESSKWRCCPGLCEKIHCTATCQASWPQMTQSQIQTGLRRPTYQQQVKFAVRHGWPQGQGGSVDSFSLHLSLCLPFCVVFICRQACLSQWPQQLMLLRCPSWEPYHNRSSPSFLAQPTQALIGQARATGPFLNNHCGQGDGRFSLARPGLWAHP